MKQFLSDAWFDFRNMWNDMGPWERMGLVVITHLGLIVAGLLMLLDVMAVVELVRWVL